MTLPPSWHSPRPFFSIVLPTRNRADVVGYALQSALDQSFDDYEIIVSDNASTDETPQVVKDFADPRIQYIRTPESLSQADSWEFALEHARGEYVAFVGDDDALCSDLLAKLMKVIRERQAPIVTWELGLYHSHRTTDPRCINAVEICPLDQQIVQLDSRAALTELYGGFRFFDWQKWPNWNNAVYHRSTIARVKSRLSRFFHPMLTDISSCIATLTQVDEFPHLRDILAIKGVGEETLSRKMLLSEGGESKLHSEFGADAEFRHVPLKSTTAANSVFETLLSMKGKLAPDLAHLEISWSNYFISCYADLIRVGILSSVDMSSELGEFERALALQPADVQEKVRLALAPGRLERLVGLEGTERRFWIIHGASAGFNNILECARVLHASLRADLAAFWDGRRKGAPIVMEHTSKSTWLWGVTG